MAKHASLPVKPLIFSVIGAVIITAAWFVIKSKLTPQQVQVAEITSAGSVTLSLSPSSLTLAPNSESTVSVTADSGTQKLTLVKFEITYDPAKVAVSGLTKGTWITKELGALTVSSGKITGILGAQPDPNVADGGAELNRTGVGTLFTFKLKPLVYGSHAVNFNVTPTLALTASNTSNTPNMLKAVNNLTISSKMITDITGTDHRVDIFDYNEFLLQFGKAGTADFNGSGLVDIYDYSRLVADYGKTW